MKKSTDLAREFFAAANESDMTALRKLCHPHVRYTAQTTGTHEGLKSVIDVLDAFHRQFRSLEWEVLDVEEYEDTDNNVTIEWAFEGKKTNGEHIVLSGTKILETEGGKIETITVYSH